MQFVATTSVRKLLLLALVFCGFVALGIFLLLNLGADSVEKEIELWFVIAFCGVGVVIPLGLLVLPRPRLTIDSYGITWTQRSDQTIPWSALSDLDVLTIGRGRQKFLGLFLSDPDEYPPRRQPKRRGPSLETKLCGADVYVPISMLNTSTKNVLNAVDQYWPPRDR